MISVNFKNLSGNIKPINGISCYDSSHPEEFFSYGFPSVRLHDQDGARPFVVDVAAIFPNFSADENDESSYDFRDTDRIIGDLFSKNIIVVYRLGNTIDHSPFPRLSVVPSDFKKWAIICEHIIMHYNEGWKDGFKYNLKYWEIWNEPDLIYLGFRTMWQGTEQEFFDLYKTASTYLKNRFPDIKIGGYGAARIKAPFFKNFLQFAKNEGLPLDFFSWHRYGSEVDELVRQSNTVRNMLDEYGFDKAESILDEWNYTENDFFGMNRWGLYDNNPQLNRSFFTRMKNEVGASYDIAVLIELLDNPVDYAHIYDGQRYRFGCMYDNYGNLTKVAHALLAFNKLAKRANRVKSYADIEGVRVASSGDDNGVDIIISCFECVGREDKLVVENCENTSSLDVYLINDFFDYERVLTVSVKNKKAQIPLSIRPYTVIHIKSAE